MTTPLDPNAAVDLGIWVVVLLIVGVVALVLFGWLLFRSGQLLHPAPLIVSISLLTAVALVSGVVTTNNDALNLAAVGFGALAGSLAVVFRDRPDPKQEDTDASRVPDEQLGDGPSD